MGYGLGLRQKPKATLTLLKVYDFRVLDGWEATVQEVQDFLRAQQFAP